MYARRFRRQATPTIARIVKLHGRQRTSEWSAPWRRVSFLAALSVSLVFVTLAMVGVGYYRLVAHELPSPEPLTTLLNPSNGSLLQPTRLYDRGHNHVLLTLQNPAAAEKQYVTVGDASLPGTIQAPKVLIDATVAGLDPDFWKAGGFSVAGALQGTISTIPQSIASNLLLDGEAPSLARNFRVRLLAAELIAQYGRERVLEWYLNSAKYGDGIYGADAASRAYFGIPASSLTISQAALLTAIAEMRGGDLAHLEKQLKQRQEQIIQKMFVDGYITGDQAFAAFKDEIKLQPQVDAQSLAPWFTALVLKQLSATIPLERLYRGGYDITTSLDFALQMQAECATQSQLASLRNAPSPVVASDGSPCDAGSLLPALKNMPDRPLDSLSAEVVMIDPRSGQILALVGLDSRGNVSSGGEHPAGTILSPLLYLTAFSRGMSPATMIWEIPANNASTLVEPGQTGQVAGQAVVYHGPLRLRNALVNDYPAAAGQVLQQVGSESVWQTEQQFGLGGLIGDNPSETSLSDLSTQEVSVLQTTSAYAVFANQGVMAGQNWSNNNDLTSPASIQPSGLLRVDSTAGQPVSDWSKAHELAVVNSQLAYLITDVLSDETARQSGLGQPSGLEIGRAAAAKTGSMADGSGAWAAGYIPQMAAGVWIGQEAGAAGDVSAELPAGVWHAVMKFATEALPVQDFDIPAGVSLAQVCDPSGLLVTHICPSIVQEVFLSGNEPSRPDDLFTQVAVDSVTGRLATVYTPAQQVENKVFMAVPPAAKTWALANGIELAPTGYDDIPAETPVITTAQITQPVMLAAVRGMVDIEGNAGGADFSYYRLETGKGLNPTDWLQIGENVDQPVSNGRLGTWDTSGLQGQYILKLMVVRKDLRFEQALIQLNVDNQPPDIQVLDPQDGEKITMLSGKPVLVNISAKDDQSVLKVEIFLDNQLEVTFLKPPYAWLWDSRPGKHILNVKAYDWAGNASQASATFTVLR